MNSGMCRRVKIYYVFPFVLLLLLIVYFISPVLVLEIKTGSGALKYLKVTPDSEFIIHRINAIELTPEQDIYFINSNKEIVLKEMVFQSWWGGLDIAPHNLRIEDKKYIAAYNRVEKEIRFRNGTIPLINFRLEIGTDSFTIDAIAKPGELVTIRTASVSRFTFYQNRRNSFSGSIVG